MKLLLIKYFCHLFILIYSINIQNDFVNELINLNIETIGIFIAIIGGLIASKIISLNTEHDDIENKIEQLDLEIEDIETRLLEKKKENLEMYKWDSYEEIIDMITDENSEYTLDDIWNPFIDLKERENFVEELKDILRNKKNVFDKCCRGEIEDEETFIEACNVRKNSLEYEILIYFYNVNF